MFASYIIIIVTTSFNFQNSVAANWYDDVFVKETSLVSNGNFGSALTFYPEDQVLNGTIVKAVCRFDCSEETRRIMNNVKLTMFDKKNNAAFSVEVARLTEKFKLVAERDQLNPLNYYQRAQCLDTKCTDIQAVIASSHIAIFQFKAHSAVLTGNYTCEGTGEYLGNDGNVLKFIPFTTNALFQVYTKPIGMPNLKLLIQTSTTAKTTSETITFERVLQIIAQCKIKNSEPLSNFVLALTYQKYNYFLDTYTETTLVQSNSTGQKSLSATWYGNKVFTSMQHDKIVCKLLYDWGENKAAKVQTKMIDIVYLYRIRLHNPRIAHQYWEAYNSGGHSLTPNEEAPKWVYLKPTEYVICAAQSWPEAAVKWEINPKDNGSLYVPADNPSTLFVKQGAKRQRCIATCTATNPLLHSNKIDKVTVTVIIAGSRCIPNTTMIFAAFLLFYIMPYFF